METQILRVGEVLVTPRRTVAEADINLFAGLVGDFTPIHVDEVFARATAFGGRIAHGTLTMSTATGLLTQTGRLGENVIGLLSLNWDFAKPVMIGDTIHARVTIAERRPTKKPGRDVVVFAFEVVNQDDVVIQLGRMTVLMRGEQTASEADAGRQTPA
ncbi:MaoC family dehydratase [Rhodoligotrophos defluvii]|uniref:MaoC family dehydratase n=1 Tax=Rhodoligotrophos defluvii TaxID=2561934 RepID=UPI001484D842|nr:MaoC/PaaZ C-terminal domain-containing protein [Rhodoligotrophos defluvii]